MAIGSTKDSTATIAAQKAAVLIASYTASCTANAVLADKGSAIRAVTEARESIARRKKELDHATQCISAHHTINL
jgi:hypothetical protein